MKTITIRESRMILMLSTSKKKIKKSKKSKKSFHGVNEPEEDASFDDWEEGELLSDPMFNEEFKKQQLDLRRKEDESREDISSYL